MLALLFACAPPVLDPGGPVLDLHTHCTAADCTAEYVEQALDGRLTVAVLGVNHYAIADTLGDPIPEEVGFVRSSNEVAWAVAESSSQVLLMPSLDCLYDTAASDPGWTEACLADADAWLDRGAVGFKDHAGKAWDGAGYDMALWVGAYNRLAGWCEVDPASETPNRDCQAQTSARMPLDQPEWRAVVKGLVEDREVPIISHAVSWREADTECGRLGTVDNCHTQGADALVEFAGWAEENLSEAARRRFVVAHVGFLDQDEARLRAVLDAGLSVDLTQTALASSGCALRTLVAEYPDQIVLGTDVGLELACVPQHYDAWMWGLLGEADQTERYRDTCRGTMTPVGAALWEVDACGIAVPEDAARRLLYDNASEILGN